ncbi:MAG: class I SAM-dependent methyltransferase [Gemmataceae bacterium]
MKAPATIPESPFVDLASHVVALSSPRRVTPSAWRGLEPVAMYLIGLLRPRVFVELGTFSGQSYCAFCQAVQELNLDTSCFAIDTWQGDHHAGAYSQLVLEELRAHHDKIYASQSELIAATFDEALPRFADSSIDLLHIDGCHTYEAVGHDYQAWLPKMSRAGVMLFHDIAVKDRPDFGVHRFWEEIKPCHPHWELRFSHGLGILAVGADVPAGLHALLSLPPVAAEQLREYFRRLGQLMWTLGDQQTELVEAKARIACLEQEARATQQEVCRLKQHYTARRFQFADRVAQWLLALPGLSLLTKATSHPK